MEGCQSGREERGRVGEGGEEETVVLFGSVSELPGENDAGKRVDRFPFGPPSSQLARMKDAATWIDREQKWALTTVFSPEMYSKASAGADR